MNAQRWFGLAAILILGLILLAKPPRTIEQNDSAAIGRLRQLGERQVVFAQRENRFACTLAELSANQEYSGYRFTLRCDESPGGEIAKYHVIAQPIQIGETGLRTYCSTETRLIWYDDEGSAEDCLRARKLAQ